ncbi:hypothetical protein GCM10007304_41240 [Rhodococcoides trifolii]|uniref:UDP-N-acetylglucosamine kinase n=1 Tax=Rhodococcoides trifolii TaxID=908250 RepID=A0A917LHB0_9NOCA|nr:hypothetical protein GCM10007304_41240 [Rhodococcus trifolii]
MAADTRTALIDAGRSFIAETVFSHESKLRLVEHARVAGYTIELHVVMIPEDLAVHRVASRVRAGGHSVPEVKIRERYGRLWALVARAAPHCDTTTFYDNSTVRGPRVVARVVGGVAVGHLEWPSWTPRALTDRWSS